MRRTLFLSYMMLIASVAFGQVNYTFTLKLERLEKEADFIPGPETRVFIRGSFNNWEGEEYELSPLAGLSSYGATFELPVNAGDTIEYKYVIEKEPGKFFWEKNPDPENPPYGNRVLIAGEQDKILPDAYYQPDPYFSYPVIFSRDKLQADFLQMRRILEETHPALYDYTEKRVLDSIFDSSFEKIDEDLDMNAFLLLATEVISQVGCGHSSMWIPRTFWDVAPDGLFPLMLHLYQDRVYVSGFYSDTASIKPGSLKPGSEIRSINGEDVAGIISRLEYLTSSDGLSPAFRRAKVAQNFSQKYAVAFGLKDSFRISYREPDGDPDGDQLKELTLTPVGKVRIDACKADLTELSFRELNTAGEEGGVTGLLTINTFGYYGEVDMFRSFLDSVFQLVDSRGIDRLILDLRGNGGGDPFCASYLWACLEPEPLPYFADIYGRYDTLANPVPLALFPYRGKLFTLIDGLGFSTTGHFCSLLKYHKVGLFVGSETGATYTCTGNATYPALDYTGLMVGTARVGRYTAAVEGMDPRRGILPDYPVEISPAELLKGSDPVLAKALELVAE